MKKLLLILFGVILFASCGHPTVEKKDLPIEVVKLKEVNSFDTVLHITTDEHVFIFDKNKEYKGRYSITNEESSLFWLGLVLGLFLLLIITVLIFDK